MGLDAALAAHLESGLTTVARCWAVTRRDGQVLGFTDHDRDLAFEGVSFRADTGLSARALQQTTGLAVDNTEAVGALSDAAISETDIAAGRFDGAEVRAWLVNWADVSERALIFRGTLGEIVRKGGAFHAELRGLAEALNQPRGRVFQAQCSAVLGDAACGVDLGAPGRSVEASVTAVEGARLFRFEGLDAHADRWFERGRLEVLDGPAEGLSGLVKNDRLDGAGRAVELWQALAIEVGAGASVRLVAGCDKRAETCRLKFDNYLNFRGFPHIPGDDWLMAVPSRDGQNDGGSLT